MKPLREVSRYQNPLGVFALAALLMLAYEAIKELIFQGTLSPWESHSITIFVTATIAVLVSLLVNRRTQQIHEAAQAIEVRKSRFLETLLSSLPMAVFYKDREGRYLGCNAVFTEIMGAGCDQLRGKTVYELWPGELAETYHRKDLELMANPQQQQYEFKVKDKHGQIRDVIYSKGVFFDENGAVGGIIGSFLDISDKKEAERQLAAYRDQLEAMVDAKTEELRLRNAELLLAKDAAEAANRAKSVFLSNMGHELRTPLNGILGFAELLQLDMKEGEQKENLQIIVDSGRQLLRLINDILEMTKHEIALTAGEVAFSVPEMLDRAVMPWRNVAEAKGIHLNLDVDSTLPNTLMGEPEKLDRVLWHLLDNAIKFSSHGAITLRAAQSEGEDGQALVRFEVEDQGIGIAEEQQQIIFEPFTQVDGSSTRTFDGAGLGLTLCQQLVQSMGGKIGVRSRLGEGSTFWFALPLKPLLPTN